MAQAHRQRHNQREAINNVDVRSRNGTDRAKVVEMFAETHLSEEHRGEDDAKRGRHATRNEHLRVVARVLRASSGASLATARRARAAGLGSTSGRRGGRGGVAWCGDGEKVGVEHRAGVGRAAARRRDLGLVGHGGNGAEGLRGLGVGLDGAGGVSVDTRVVLVITEAGLEGPVLGVVGRVVCTANTVVYVLAKVGGVGVGGVADFDAEGVTTHEVVPFDHLFDAVTESRRVHEATQGVTALPFVSLEVDEGLIDETDNLGISGGAHVLNTLERVLGDQTSTVAGLCAPCHHLTLGVRDDGVGIHGRPQAEVWYESA